VYLAPVAISPHQGDDSRPGFIPASTPDVLDQRADEQGENIHLIGARRAQNSGIDSELTFPTSGNASLDAFAQGEITMSESNRCELPFPPSIVTCTPVLVPVVDRSDWYWLVNPYTRPGRPQQLR
jgi:hypothetical protein